MVDVGATCGTTPLVHFHLVSQTVWALAAGHVWVEYLATCGRNQGSPVGECEPEARLHVGRLYVTCEPLFGLHVGPI